MTRAQAWFIIAELGVFNVILAVTVTLTILSGLRRNGKNGNKK